MKFKRCAVVAELADAYVWVYDYSVMNILVEMINRFATLTNELSEQYNKNAGGRAGIGRQACLRGM